MFDPEIKALPSFETSGNTHQDGTASHPRGAEHSATEILSHISQHSFSALKLHVQVKTGFLSR